MVDNMNPTSQFHPYVPETSQPASERQQGGWLNNLRNMSTSSQWNQQLGKFREYAQSNPAKVLGGLAALVIGAGLLRRR